MNATSLFPKTLWAFLLSSSLMTNTLRAADVNWVGDVNDSWNNNANWDAGTPDPDDNAILTNTTFGTKVELNEPATIRGLTVGNGIDLDLNGFGLSLEGGPSGPANPITVTGNGSTLIIPDAPLFVRALFTDSFHLTSGGEMRLGGFAATGASIQVWRDGSTIDDGSILSGNGYLVFPNAGHGSNTTVLRNEGTIRAQFGTLQLTDDGLPPGLFDLDGFSGNGVLDVDDGSFLSTDVELIIRGPSTDPFDGTIQVGQGDKLRFRESTQLGANGLGSALVEMNGNNGIATLTVDNPETLTVRGVDTEINILSGTARFSALLNIREANINVADDTTVWFDGDADIGANVTFNPGSGYNLRVSGQTVFRQAVVDWDGPQQAANHETLIDRGGILEFQSDRIDISDNKFDGRVIINGGLLSVITDDPWIFDGRMSLVHVDSAIAKVSGQELIIGNGVNDGLNDASITVTAGGSGNHESEIAAAVTFRSDAEVLIVPGSQLRLTSNSKIDQGAEFSGDGTLINDGNMNVEGGVHIATKLENVDRLTIAAGGNFGELTVDEYEQSGTFSRLTLEIRSAQFDVFDRLTVSGNATLDGILDVDLINPVAPAPGDQFPLITAANITGTFNSLQLPALDPGNMWNLQYNRTSVILEVISALTADFDHDGDVDGRDFLVWQRGGSPNGINSGDLALWQSQYGSGAGPSSAPVSVPVPEPATFLLLLMFAASLFRSRFDRTSCISVRTVGRQNIVSYAWFAMIALTTYGPAVAADKFFTNGLADDNWENSSNWTPSGEPTTSDRAFVRGEIANLFNDTAAVDDLFISNGGEVRTGSFQLSVDDGDNTAETSIGGVGSRLVVTPRATGGQAFDTDLLQINSGGLLDMAGGQVEVNTTFNITSGGTLSGNGQVLVFRQGTSSVTTLYNNGTIRATGGTLIVRAGDDTAFDLDGAAIGVLEAVDGSSTLVIDGYTRDPFDGIMNIGAGNTIQFDQEWRTGHLSLNIGTINFNTAGGMGTISGAKLFHGGTMNVNGGTALIDAPIVFFKPPSSNSSSIVNVYGTNDELQLGKDATIGAGTSFTGNGRLVNLVGNSLSTEDNAAVGITLENQGVLVLGDGPSQLEVDGFTQTPTGTLEIEIVPSAPVNHDTLTVQGNAILAGTLEVGLPGAFTPVMGNSFTILETISGDVTGLFDTKNLPVFNDLTFDVIYHSQSVVLEVVSALTGDFDHDGDVDGHDFLVWQRGDSPNGTGSGDLALWQSQYGNTLPLEANATAVPEPVSLWLIGSGLLAGSFLFGGRRG